ncbi:MAG: hypothetical protein ABLQ96_08205, partial [Candidatus Acidiferrum sp.]
DHMASGRSQLDWLLYQVGMLSFRSFAGNKASWLLNYSWDGDKGVAAPGPMKNLAMSQVMAGVNGWDAPGHSMAGSNDPKTRAEIFNWIAKHEKVFYSPRTPMHPVGVYFSPKSRNYDSAGFLPAYRGVLSLLLQKHRELQVVTPRTLAEFRGAVLVLPNVSVLAEDEKAKLREFVTSGGRLVITGVDATEFGESKSVTRFAECPAKVYFEQLQKDFLTGSVADSKEFLASMDSQAQMAIDAPPTVISNIALVDGAPHIFFANFTGLVPHKIATPTAQTGVRISVPTSKKRILRVLPFLGEVQSVQGQSAGGRTTFTLPPLERGAVAWIADEAPVH